jgi:hypothetical protein
MCMRGVEIDLIINSNTCVLEIILISVRQYYTWEYLTCLNYTNI